MAVTLARLFANTEKNYKIRLLAGQKGMKSLVRWVHMVEDSEVPGFLHGNELIMTTGIAHGGSGWLVEFVKSLRKHGAIGLILNVGPYIKEIPASVTQYCDDNGFPLFTVPWEIHLIDVTFDFCHRIIENEEHETDTASAFRNLIFTPGNKNAYVQPLGKGGFHNRGEYTLMLIQAVKNEKLILGDEWNNLKFGLQSVLRYVDKPICIFDQENYLVIIASGIHWSQMEGYGKLIEKELFPEEEVQLFIGISDTVMGYNELHFCYRQAVTSVSTAKLLRKETVKYQDTGIYKLLYAVEETGVLKRYLSDTLWDIREYDSLHNTDFENTLKVYLENNGSIQKVSVIMNVHRNTVNYKMKSIREIFGLKMDYDDIARLWLAFNIKKITSE
ncbi:PucR family transcriptional regulator [Clostridium sp. KNHs205]|jgi:PucR family transcriptional regulator, proline-responsive transcriptional activator|uniref:PucR family transcriptional regulator n=1 Tax=Clostridium sp. KNHs205 TaxID=1449050 RepID=UPI00068F4960|nr:PucR family transcriptional regulator [Clostridium sp. KNHs205]